MVLLKRGKSNWVAVYVPKDNILKEMATKIEFDKTAFFFDLVWELSDTPHIYRTSDNFIFVNL
jgi:hypothetical protein